jgi:hypothetical protein
VEFTQKHRGWDLNPTNQENSNQPTDSLRLRLKKKREMARDLFKYEGIKGEK